jgi:hypothetical protein
MYPTSGATLRADLNIKVEEASAAETFFIGDRVMPPMSVDAKSGTYPKIDIAGGELLSAGSTTRERGGSYGKIVRKWGSDNYDCVDRGLEEPVDDTDAKDMARFFNLESAAARLTMRNMKTSAEVRIAAATMNATNYGAATNSAVAYTEALIATINFARDIGAAVERVNNNGAAANTIVMSSTVLERLKRSTLLQSFVRGSIVGQTQTPINAASIAQAFADYGITQVLVGRARYNTAKKGQAYVAGNVWGTTYVWVGYINPSATTPMDGGAGFTFYWNAEGGLYVTETYRDEAVRSNMVRVRQNTTEKVTDGTAGTLIATQWA